MTITTPTGEAEVYRPPFNISGMGEPPVNLPALGDHDPELIERLLARAEERAAD